jgi:hypothetical protein
VVLDLSEPVALSVSVRRTRGWLLVLVGVLLVLDELVLFARYGLGHGRLGGLYGLFDLDVETSVSTFVQSTLLVGAAVAFFVLGRARPDVRSVAWVLGGATLWVAADEASQIHELLIVPIDRLLDTSGVWRLGWVIPGIAVAAAVVVLTVRLVRVLDPDVRRLLVFGGALYLAGALGFEMLGAAWSDAHGQDAVYRIVFTSIEETLEGVGIVLAFCALLEAIRRAAGRVDFTLDP